MGRGKGWSEEDAQAVRVYMADGFGPTKIHQLRPHWSLHSVKKLVARLRKTGAKVAYRGRGGGKRPVLDDQKLEDSPTL